MQRQLMLHSYLPSQLVSTMVVGSLVELCSLNDAGQPPWVQKGAAVTEKGIVSNGHASRSTKEKAKRSNQVLPISIPGRSAWAACVVILVMTFAFWCFWFPLTYGYPTMSNEGFSTREILGQFLHYVGDDERYNCYRKKAGTVSSPSPAI